MIILRLHFMLLTSIWVVISKSSPGDHLPLRAFNHSFLFRFGPHESSGHDDYRSMWFSFRRLIYKIEKDGSLRGQKRLMLFCDFIALFHFDSQIFKRFKIVKIHGKWQPVNVHISVHVIKLFPETPRRTQSIKKSLQTREEISNRLVFTLRTPHDLIA